MKAEVKAATAALEERARLEAALEKVISECAAASSAIPLADEALARAHVELRLGERQDVPEALQTAAHDARRAVVALASEAEEIARRIDADDARLEAAANALRLAARGVIDDAARRLADARAKATDSLAPALRRYRAVLNLAGVEPSRDLDPVFGALLALGVAPGELNPSVADDAGMAEGSRLHAELCSALGETTSRRTAEALRRARSEEGAG